MLQHRSSRIRARYRSIILIVGLIGLLLIVGILQGPVSADDIPASRRVLVDASDSALRANLRSNRAQLLVDYGTFALWEVPAEVPLPSSLQERAATFNHIVLRDEVLDTGTTPAPTSQRRARLAGQQFWLVQFIGPVKEAWLADIEAAGLDIVAYMPHYAYVVWGDNHSLQQLDRLATTDPLIQWTGAYAPEYRLAPALKQAAASLPGAAPLDVTIQIYRSATTDQTLDRLRDLALSVHHPAADMQDFRIVSLQLPAAAIARVATWNDVYNIEPWTQPVKHDEIQNQLVAGNVITEGIDDFVVPEGPGYLTWLESKGFPQDPERYPIIDVVDTGLDTGDINNLHPDLYELGDTSNPARVVAIANCTSDPEGNGEDGHGTLNAGILAGYNDQTTEPYIDDEGYSLGLGVSPYSRLSSTKIFTKFGYSIVNCGGADHQEVVAQSVANDAVMSLNSWGVPTSKGAYTIRSQSYDMLTRDASSSQAGHQEMLHVFAAGNSGPADGTVQPPGTGKNVLTVGASESVRDQGVLDGCNDGQSNNANDMADFSGRGPTIDGRSKPDIVAPGVHIQSIASQDPDFTGSGPCGPAGGGAYYPPGQELYTWSSGTSHAAPAVAGAASLLYEYYGRVLDPGQVPSPAMLKALLLNTPRYMDGLDANDTLPGAAQGWGNLSLDRVLDDTPMYLLDQEVLLNATGQTYTISGQVAQNTRPVQVSLVWTDAPGSTTGAAYVNNLDLEVSVDGSVYRGNVFDGPTSVPGGSFDEVNNVENVFVPAGVSGDINVRVIARNIAGDGVPDNADSNDQDFALVVYNYQPPSGTPPDEPITFLDVTVDSDTLPADGQSTTTVRASLTYSDGSPASVQPITFETDLGQISTASVQTDEGGKASATLQTGTTPGVATVTVQAPNGTSHTVTVVFESMPDIFLPLIVSQSQ